MEATTLAFEDNAHAALREPALQAALGKIKHGWVASRARASDRLPEFEALRDLGRDIKNHALAHLDLYLEAFEAKVIEGGGSVHWARDAAEARAIVLELCEAAGARRVTKSKSMITEEIGLNHFLEANGLEPVETDLGEYIIQLRGEHPSHIIAPAIHVNLDQVSDAFHAHHGKYGKTERQTEPRALMNEAREILRDKFIAADVGITGANFCIAETGTTVIVTNEGNGDLTQTLPRVHVAVTSIEKVVPTLEDATLLHRLLSRSATGQEIEVYGTWSSGPRRPEDPDGPAEYHVVLLDNGRSNMLGNEFREMLRCIRCSACMNHCPVYGAIGGHAYGTTYPGPIGKIVSPHMMGLEETHLLPTVSTLCGACGEVCPVKIPIPELLIRLREEAQSAPHAKPAMVGQGAGYSALTTFVWRMWARVYGRPGSYRVFSWLATRFRMFAPSKQAGWTAARTPLTPAPRRLRDMVKDRR